MKVCEFWFKNLTAYSNMYPWNLISLEYMHNITINIKAKTISNTPNTIDQTPPSNADTKDVAKVKIPKAKSRMIAATNEIIGEYLGRQ